MVSGWVRLAPKWYRSVIDQTVTVGTFCDCRRSYCQYRYAVFVDKGFGEESVDGLYGPTLRDVKGLAMKYLESE